MKGHSERLRKQFSTRESRSLYLLGTASAPVIVLRYCLDRSSSTTEFLMTGLRKIFIKLLFQVAINRGLFPDPIKIVKGR
jgi:hypothetical protein